MQTEFDASGDVVVVTGASGSLGSAVVDAFIDAGATVCASDQVPPESADSALEPAGPPDFYEADFTAESEVERVLDSIVDLHGSLEAVCPIAGTWRGGTPIESTDVETFEFLFDVNLKTMFLAAKHAVPHLVESNGALVSVSSRSSLEGGTGDGPYRASKAGVRLLTETIAAEHTGELRANAIMPSIIDTPANRELMPDADHDEWVDPEQIARTILALCSDSMAVTSGAAVPVYGEA